MNIMNQKSQYWQAIRGICILAVIAIHCPKGTEGIELYAWLGIRQLINFPVALFIFMAGYFVKPEKVGALWLKNRGGRLLVPFLTWSGIYTAKNVLFGNKMNINEIIVNFITGQSSCQLYYILVMIQLVLLTQIFLKIKNRKWLYIVTPLYICGVYILNFTVGSTPSLYMTFFPAWISFYILGMDAKEGKLKYMKVRLWMIFVAVFSALVECYFLMSNGFSTYFASDQLRIPIFIYSTLIATWLSQHEIDIKDNILSKVGDLSFSIYFSHMLCMWVVIKILTMIGIDSWYIKWLLTFILTTAASFTFVRITRKFLHGKMALKYIGFD